MDEYLVPNSNIKRLLKEYITYGNIVAGIDFDNTLFDFHKTGASHEMVRQLVRDLKEIGCKIVIWTAQKDLPFVENFLKEIKIEHDGINVDIIDLGWSTRKPFFSALLDDRAGLESAYRDLELFVYLVKEFKLKK